MYLLGLSTAIAYRPPGCSPRLIPSVQNYCAEVIDGTYKRDSTTEGGSEGILRAIRSLNAFMLNLSACIVFAHSLSLSLSLNGALILCYLRALLLCYLMLPDEQASSIICGTTLRHHFGLSDALPRSQCPRLYPYF